MPLPNEGRIDAPRKALAWLRVDLLNVDFEVAISGEGATNPLMLALARNLVDELEHRCSLARLQRDAGNGEQRMIVAGRLPVRG